MPPPRTERTHGRLPFFLAPPFLRTIGLAAAVALATELVLLPRLLAIDAAFWRWMLLARGCRTDGVVDGLVSGTTRGMAVLLIAATVFGLRRGVRHVWPPLAVCAIGLYVGKVLKNVFARERPSMLPELALGHSFPSAHVMNTTLAALAVVVLAAGFRHPRRWSTAAGLGIAIVFAGRLALAHHWFLDALGGMLAAVALMGLGLEWFRRRPLLAPAGLAIALTLVLAAVVHERALGIRLPSPLSARGESTIEIRPDAALGTPTLTGGWEGPLERYRGGSVAWLRGAGAVAFELPDTMVATRDPVPAGSQAILAIAGRPDIAPRRCLALRVAVNGTPLAPFVPFVGWREYRLLVPPGTLRPGTNEVRLEVATPSGDPWRFAVAYLRIDAN
jgi:membrane-associated phospholipid phosphatase